MFGWQTPYIDHMFLRCSLTQSFWSLFQNLWVSKTKETVTLSNSVVLYGVFENMKHIHPLNYALLISKYSIYDVRFLVTILGSPEPVHHCLLQETWSVRVFLTLIALKETSIFSVETSISFVETSTFFVGISSLFVRFSISPRRGLRGFPLRSRSLSWRLRQPS